MRAGLILASVLLTLTACATPDRRESEVNLNSDQAGLEIDAIVQSVVDRGDVVGVSVAVLKEGRPVRIQGYGSANLENGVAVSSRSRFYLGSITKTFTAASIMKLVEDGLLNLDDEIALHLTELEQLPYPVTLRHLLNHTSGLPGPQQVLSRFVDRRHLEFTQDELIDLVLAEPPLAPPGTRHAYNNLGYILLGLVIERASGQSFEASIQANLPGTVADGDILLCDTRRIIPHRVAGYAISGDATVNHEPVNASLVFAAGGLCANAADTAYWFRALLTGEIVDADTLRQMTTQGSLDDGTVLSYGYGVFIESSDRRTRIHHGGDVNGFSARASHDLENDITVVILTNTRGRAARDIEDEISNRVITMLIEEAP